MAVLLDPASARDEVSASTIATVVDAWAARAPDRLVLASPEGTLTYSAWTSQADACARGLLAQGIGKGDRVALMIPNSPNWVVLALAAWKIGAIVVPLSTWSRADEWSYQLRHSDSTVLMLPRGFLSHCYLDELLRLCPELLRARDPGERFASAAYPFLRLVVVLESQVASAIGALTLGSLLEAGQRISTAHLAAACAQVVPDDECVVLYTSGSTGKPKGVVHVHSALTRNGANIARAMSLSEADRAYSHFPFFFSAGLCNALMSVVAAGGGLVTQPAFEPAGAMDMIEQYRCTARMLWSTAVRAITAHPAFHPGRLASATKGTRLVDALHPELVLPADRGVSMYGMTETCTAFTCTEAGDSEEVRLQTHGRPFPGTQLQIVDPGTGAIQPPGAEGEIRVRGHNVLRRYHRLPPEKALDSDGFLRTGDRGLIDGDGRLRWRGRLKELIKTSGFSVYPEEVEEALIKHPLVRQACVLGIPDATREEMVVAVVAVDSAEANSGGAAKDLDSYCRDRLSSYKVPVRFEILTEETFPLTSSGKPNRALLRENLLRQQTGERNDKPN